jgi:hypothetical protein
MLKLLLLLIVIGVVGLVGYRWWKSQVDGTPSGGYHGVGARRYRVAYRLCNRAVSNGKVDLSRLNARQFGGRFRQVEIKGCLAGAKKAGLGDVLNQLEHQLP